VQRILVTGANKGIGLAIVEAILAEHADAFVYLGSRDLARGQEAVAGLVRDHASWKARLDVVEMDVAAARSIESAAARVAASAGEKLYAIVNNAGIASGDLAAVLTTNVVGVHDVCEAFLPLLDAKTGRIVNVTSAAGPSFVATCSPEQQRFFLDSQTTWPKLQAFIDDCIAMGTDTAAFAAKGLGDGGPYGLSKACANTYTLLLAREHPSLRVNACTPGFIETDLSRHFVNAQGKTAAELGMKTPAEGARAPMHLLFGDLEGNGHYYGSDAKRSPLDRYRAPGSPAFAGSGSS
jgi:NAD(P)-dependent dehydrogenase (short-subunit alcohol dehydrogenase family)